MLLILIVLLGALLRFANLMWGNGHYFHPDENNMASSIVQMTPEEALHPNFFAYGQFPLYVSYFLAQGMYYVAGFFAPGESELTTTFLSTVTHKDAVFGLRVIAATASTSTIILIYHIVKHILNEKGRGDSQKTLHNQSMIHSANFYPLLAAALTACVPAFIQSAHFGTTESLLTFFFVAITYASLRLISLKRLLASAVTIGLMSGLALGTKITAASFLVAPFIATLLANIQHIHSRTKKALAKIVVFVLIVWVAVLFFVISSPYTVLDFKHFQETSAYETEVAIGKSSVFYTRQFIDTIPFVFQLQNVFPFTLGFALFVLGSVGILMLPFLIGSEKSPLLRKQYAVLLGSFLIFFVANSILFVKWTRFLTPVLPFFIIFGVLTFALFEKRLERKARVYIRIVAGLVALYTAIAGLAFFSIYARDDVRHTASEWIYENIPKGSYVLSETGNVVDIPLHIQDEKTEEYKNTGTYEYTVVSFDFYGLDEREDFQEKLIDDLEKADYIFVPSRRIFSNHTRFPEKFPWVNNYYVSLWNGELGFEEIKTISSYPSLLGIQFPDEHAEETWTVFDHPVVRIYLKTNPLSRDRYLELLNKAQ